MEWLDIARVLILAIVLVAFAFLAAFLARRAPALGRRLVLAGTIVLSAVLLWIALGPLGFLLAGLLVAGLLALVWFYLAPQNRFFTFVDEGTAKVVSRGGEAVKLLIQLRGYRLDQDWNVVPGREWHPFGGLRFYGFWPVDDVYIYRFQWTGVAQDGTIQPHSPEWLDYILLKQDVYAFRLERAEDRDLLPLEVWVLLTIRVVNPYLALFNVQNWLETVINRLGPLVRDRMAAAAYEQLIAQRGSMGGELFQGAAALRQEFRDQYGVELVAIEVRDINPDEERRAATLQKWQAQRDADRIRVIADAEKTRYRTLGVRGLVAGILDRIGGRGGRRA